MHNHQRPVSSIILSRSLALMNVGQGEASSRSCYILQLNVTVSIYCVLCDMGKNYQHGICFSKLNLNLDATKRVNLHS